VADRWVTIREAAHILGVSESAIRKRLSRGTLIHEKREGGRVYILADELADTSDTHESHTLISHVDDLRDQVTWLRHEVERKDTIIMQLSQSSSQLEAPPEAPGASVTGAEESGGGPGGGEGENRRPWWRKMFGG
jgi:DNA-binding transcriptional MerR regulator